MSRSKNIQNEISVLLRARNSFLWMQSTEEIRAERVIVEAAASANYTVEFWDCATGISNAAGEVVDASCQDPNQMLVRIMRDSSRKVYVMRDLHKWLGDPVLLRSVRSASRALQSTPRESARAIIVLTPPVAVPEDLAGQVIQMKFELPDRGEMAAIFDSVIDALPEKVKANVHLNGNREAAIDAAMGLNYEKAASCFSKSLVQVGDIDVDIITKEKKREVANEGGLICIDSDPRGMDAVGGLDNLKDWATARRSAFSARAREYGLPSPKGMLCVGVPGCGKSLMAKCLSTSWQMPLLRFDLGATKSKYVGESEASLRRVLALAETVSPCILWIDEIEKALAGASSEASDGGVSQDMLGTLLSWMQDHTAPVFLFATANDVTKLPAELMRKGRFDEIFFVGLPNLSERVSVLSVTLTQYNRLSADVDVDRVAAATAGFSGAELAALIPDAMFVAFNDGEREITTEDVLACLNATTPLSKTSQEKIDKLLDWAKGRARSASVSDAEVCVGTGRSLDL